MKEDYKYNAEEIEIIINYVKHLLKNKYNLGRIVLKESRHNQIKKFKALCKEISTDSISDGGRKIKFKLHMYVEENRLICDTSLGKFIVTLNGKSISSLIYSLEFYVKNKLYGYNDVPILSNISVPFIFNTKHGTVLFTIKELEYRHGESYIEISRSSDLEVSIYRCIIHTDTDMTCEQVYLKAQELSQNIPCIFSKYLYTKVNKDLGLAINYPEVRYTSIKIIVNTDNLITYIDKYKNSRLLVLKTVETNNTYSYYIISALDRLPERFIKEYYYKNSQLDDVLKAYVRSIRKNIVYDDCKDCGKNYTFNCKELYSIYDYLDNILYSNTTRYANTYDIEGLRIKISLTRGDSQNSLRIHIYYNNSDYYCRVILLTKLDEALRSVENALIYADKLISMLRLVDKYRCNNDNLGVTFTEPTGHNTHIGYINNKQTLYINSGICTDSDKLNTILRMYYSRTVEEKLEIIKDNIGSDTCRLLESVFSYFVVGLKDECGNHRKLTVCKRNNDENTRIYDLDTGKQVYLSDRLYTPILAKIGMLGSIF